MSTQTAIQTKHLVKCFGDNQVIKDCSMCIEKGTIYGFLGTNGAGKTTVFKLLTGSLIEAPAFYEHLSARKNLEIHLAYMENEEFWMNRLTDLILWESRK